MHTDIARNFVPGFDIPCYLYKFLSVIQFVDSYYIKSNYLTYVRSHLLAFWVHMHVFLP